uniref:(northern house mosquito) hypothetical protein n=1 Tax=Culex pipiens TaxID=7175 RepID=A0A8D8BAT4_CULPI
MIRSQNPLCHKDNAVGLPLYFFLGCTQEKCLGRNLIIRLSSMLSSDWLILIWLLNRAGREAEREKSTRSFEITHLWKVFIVNGKEIRSRTLQNSLFVYKIDNPFFDV